MVVINLLLNKKKQKAPLNRSPSNVQRRTQSVAIALLRQDMSMTPIMRERWREPDVDSLPSGEHDYFERKSGLLFNNMGELLGKLAKTVSALANSGGGHIVLGMDDTGVPDGVPPLQGRTSTRDWLEQKIPYLVDYPLTSFRVHVVERATPSRIPPDREVIVIDIGDSPLAPHQCAHGGSDAKKYTYYYRQAGRSEPAPHFYLELLRQRLVNPVLEVESVNITPAQAQRVENTIFLGTTFHFSIENTGRIAAYSWGIRWVDVAGHPVERLKDYRYAKQDYPSGARNNISIRSADAILPGMNFGEDQDWGVILRPVAETRQAVQAEIEQMVIPVILGYRLATETSRGELRHIELRHIANSQQLTEFVLSRINKRRY